MANPFFDVIRNQLFTQFNEEDVYVERDALLNGETGSVLGTVGEKYKVITNQEVDDIFREAFAGLPIESVNDHLNWKENRWQRDFILNGDEFNITIGGNVVQTKISIWNGYDGRSSVGFSVSGYVSRNNVTLLSKMFGKTYTHMKTGLVENIRGEFRNNLRKYQAMASLFESWSRQTFSRENFESFVRSNIRVEGNTNGTLSERQAEAIIDSYEYHLGQCGVGNTRWGAYNVISSIASNDVAGRNGSSGIFAEGYKRMERLAQNFFELETDLFVI